MRRLFFLIVGALFLAFGLRPSASAQSTGGSASEDASLEVGVRGDTAYVYHTARIPLGYGVRVERRMGSGSYEAIRDSLVFARPSTPSFREAVGTDRFEQLRRALRKTNDARVYYTLRSDQEVGIFTAFAYPEVGRALGRLAIDPNAPVGQTATYRMIVVDDLGRPAGDTLETTARIVEREAPTPANLSADNDNGRVTVSWTYPETTRDSGDQVIRFEIFRRGADGAPIRVNAPRAILRDIETRDYTYDFTVPAQGQTEVIVVRAVQITGKAFDSPPLQVKVTDTAPPRTPGAVETFVRPTEEVEVSWSVSTEPDAAGYRVYRAQRLSIPPQPLHKEPLDLLETVYVDSTARAEEIYYYKVSAVDSSGNESSLSAPVRAFVRDVTPPPAPTDLQARITAEKEIEMTWQAPGGVPEDLSTFVVFFRRSDSGPGWTRVDDGNTRGATFTTNATDSLRFLEGAYYEVGVAAEDSSLNRSDSLFATVQVPDVIPPQPPASAVVRNLGGVRAELRWTQSLSGDVVEYRVYRAVGAEAFSDSTWVTLPGDRASVRDERVEAGQTYRYAVAAVDSSGNASPRTEADPFRMRDRTAPPAVRNVQAQRQADGVLVVWEPSPSSDVVGYRVMRASIPTGQFETVGPVPLDETRFVDTIPRDPDMDEAYYRVFAIDSSGNISSASDPAKARAPATP